MFLNKVFTLSLLIITQLIFLIPNINAELTQYDLEKNDLEKISKLIQDSEKRMKEHIDLKIETVNAKIQGLDDKFTSQIQGLDDKFTSQIQGLQRQINMLFWIIIALIPAAIALPQILIWIYSRKNGVDKSEFEKLVKHVEAIIQN